MGILEKFVVVVLATGMQLECYSLMVATWWIHVASPLNWAALLLNDHYHRVCGCVSCVPAAQTLRLDRSKTAVLS